MARTLRLTWSAKPGYVSAMNLYATWDIPVYGLITKDCGPVDDAAEGARRARMLVLANDPLLHEQFRRDGNIDQTLILLPSAAVRWSAYDRPE